MSFHVTDTLLTIAQDFQYCQPGWMGKRLKYLDLHIE